MPPVWLLTNRLTAICITCKLSSSLLMQCLAPHPASALPEGRLGSRQLPRRQRWRPRHPSRRMQTCRPLHQPGAALGLSWPGLFPPASVCQLWLWHYRYAVPAPASTAKPYRVMDVAHVVITASLTNGKEADPSRIQWWPRSASTRKHNTTSCLGQNKKQESIAKMQAVFHRLTHKAGVVESFRPAC